MVRIAQERKEQLKSDYKAVEDKEIIKFNMIKEDLRKQGEEIK